jgi:outer membrane immunogenic protein
MMRNTLLAALGVAALGVAPAAAADLAARPYTKAPPPVVAPFYDWSGFYIGLNGGAGWARNCLDIDNFIRVGAVAAFREGCHDANGAVFGGQIGYRWQASNWVFGVEAQGDWADLNGSNVSAFVNVWNNHSKVDSFGLFTGQVGYAWNSVLWYVKGGAAVTHDKFQGIFIPTGAPFDNASETTWVVRSVLASNGALRRTGRSALNMITCSWVTTISASRRRALWVSRPPAANSVSTTSARMSTSRRSGSTTALAGRS